MKACISECANLLQHNPNICYRCAYIVDNFDEPWSHETLKVIFNDGKSAPKTISDEQLYKGTHDFVISIFSQSILYNFLCVYFFFELTETEYFTIERGCMIQMRVQALIESKCDKLALNLLTEALRVIRTCTNDHLLRRTISVLQHQNLLEMYFSLLYKFKESSRLKCELEAMDIEAAKEFIINSFATIDANEATNPKLKPNPQAINTKMSKTDNKQSYIVRLHKYHASVSQYALQLILVRMLSGEYGMDDLENVFTALLTEWIRRNKHKENFDELFQKLIQTASSNSVIYDCCEILYRLVS